MNITLKATLDMLRPRPPYWNNCGKVVCCEVGENYLHDLAVSGK